jgi:cobalt/nickel transport system permease protein
MSFTLKHNLIPDSPLARWDSRWKLAAFFFAVAAVACSNHLAPAAAALGFSSLLLVVAKLPSRWLRVRLVGFTLAALPFVIVLPFTLDGDGWDLGPLHFSERGFLTGLAVFCRGLAIGCFTLLLIGTAPLHLTLAAAHRLKVPGLLVLLALLAHRYAFLLFDETRRLRVAMRVRGFKPAATQRGWRTLGHAIGAGLVRGSDRSERVAEAMRCRGFDGRFHTLIAFTTRRRDVVFFLLALLFAAGLTAWDRL